jgi:hypothetical protein
VINQNTTQPEGTAAKRARCEIPGCQSPAIYRGSCSPEHFQERALRRRAALHGVKVDDPSSSDRTDIDGFRAGTYDAADRDAVMTALCDEVERQRAALKEVADGRDEARAVFQRHMAAANSEIAELREQAAAAAGLRELLRAALEVIDLPQPAAHIDWEQGRRELLEKRARDVRIGLNGFLNAAAPFETTLGWVRQSVEDYPVNYKVEEGES